MRKLLISLSSTVLTSVSTTSAMACAWTTPPLSVQEIAAIMQDLKDQAQGNSALNPAVPAPVVNSAVEGSNIIYDISNNGYLPSWISLSATADDINNYYKTDHDGHPTQAASKAIGDAQAWSDKITPLLGSEIASLVKSGKGLNGQTFNYGNIKYQNFDPGYFTVFIANVSAKTGDKTSTPDQDQPAWFFSNKDQKSLVTFKNKLDNKPIADGVQSLSVNAGFQGTEYSYLDIGHLWENNKLFTLNTTDNSVTQNINFYHNKTTGDVYTIRFLVKFSPEAKFNVKSIAFYVDMDFKARIQ